MNQTRIVGGRLVTAAGVSDPTDIEVRDGLIVGLSATGRAGAAGDESDAVDVRGRLVAPGFIDLQLNGGWGHDFTTDPASIAAVAARLPETGVTAFLPTIISSSRGGRSAAIDAFASLVVGPVAAAAIGLHLEGPAISHGRPGVHDPRAIGLPADDELAEWSRGNGVVLVTLAPELDGAPALIAELVERGVVVAAGHTDCTAEQFAAGRVAGIGMVTHLFNAMAPFSHRAPGPVGAALADDSVAVGLICDGVHVDPVAVRVAWRALGPARTILITDAVAALGQESSTAHLGGMALNVDGQAVRTPEGVLAGSNLSLDQAVRNLVAFTGCSPADAIRTVTLNPAELLGLGHRGRIEVGARADLVVLDEALRVERTLIGGATAWKS